MPNANEHAYTVNILFSHDLSKILLIRKNRTDFINKLNGPGGAIEPGELPYDSALREIFEETGLSVNDFIPLHNKLPDRQDARLIPLGTLTIPYDCKMKDGATCVLHYFAGRIRHCAEDHIKPDQEPLTWMPAHTVMSSRTDSRIFAGNGNLAYFSAAAHRALVPDMTGIQNKPDPDQPFEDGLTYNINRMRGRLDADFRDGDMYQASLDAAEISRMCYAAYCMSLHDAKTTKAEEKAKNAAHQNHQNPNSPKTFSDGSVE